MRQTPDLEELLDVVGELLSYSRAGTFDQVPGEDEAFDRAVAALRKHGRSLWYEEEARQANPEEETG